MDKNINLDWNSYGIPEASKEVEILNDPDVDTYLWITNTKSTPILGASPIGYACDNVDNQNVALARGPSGAFCEEENCLLKTAKVIGYATAIVYLLVKFNF